MPLPPLVAPVAALPGRERERTARQSRLPAIGEVGQRRLAGARVAVIGAGGIGSPVLLYLASAGVGTLGIIDADVVDASNLQRQVLFGIGDVGRSKVEVAAARVRELAPDALVTGHGTRLTADNARALLTGHDLVIDGTDSFETRYAVADACDELGIPLVWGSVLRFDAQVSVFWSRPPRDAAVRLRDVFPAPPPAGSVPSCADAGVLGALCGQVGSLLVAEAVKLICGIGEPLIGRMLVLDALTARQREIPLVPTEVRMAGEVDAGAGSDVGPALADASDGPPPHRTIVRPDELAVLPGADLLDVRSPAEHAAGSIPGARHLPLETVLADPAAVRITRPLVVYCALGPRARSAASALRAAHPDADVRVLAGGYEAWSAAHHLEDARR